MNHNDVLLIGVFDNEGNEEPFVYSTNAPTNLWIGCRCSDDSVMSIEFMAWVLNGLIDEDAFDVGSCIEIVDQNGVALHARIGEDVKRDDVQAFHAGTTHVRPVTVEVLS